MYFSPSCSLSKLIQAMVCQNYGVLVFFCQSNLQNDGQQIMDVYQTSLWANFRQNGNDPPQTPIPMHLKGCITQILKQTAQIQKYMLMNNQTKSKTLNNTTREPKQTNCQNSTEPTQKTPLKSNYRPFWRMLWSVANWQWILRRLWIGSIRLFFLNRLCIS